jgi:hypothetical protein
MFTIPQKLERKNRWYQFSIRTLLLFVTFAAILCCLLRIQILQAIKQRESVAAIEELGMGVLYDYQRDAYIKNIMNPQSPTPS